MAVAADEAHVAQRACPAVTEWTKGAAHLHSLERESASTVGKVRIGLWIAGFDQAVPAVPALLGRYV